MLTPPHTLKAPAAFSGWLSSTSWPKFAVAKVTVRRRLGLSPAKDEEMVLVVLADAPLHIRDGIIDLYRSVTMLDVEGAVAVLLQRSKGWTEENCRTNGPSVATVKRRLVAANQKLIERHMGDQDSYKAYIVTPEVNEDAFVQRLFDAAPTARTRPRLQWAAAAAVLMMVASGALLLWSRAHRPLAPGASMRADDRPVTVALGADGSSFTLDEKSQAQLVALGPTDVVVELTKGRANFAVAHNPARSFRVLAGTTEVRVHGTRFAVERVGDSAVVVVTEGKVEVRERGQWVMNLEASQRYTGPAAAGETARADEADLNNEGRAAPDVVDDTEPATDDFDLSPKDVPSASPPRPKHPVRRSTAKAGTARGGATGPATVASVSPSDTRPPSTVDEAEQLFEQVREERRQAHYAKAASLLGVFLERYSNNEQAGLAAFELARLRMDQLNDVAGAIAPLEMAQKKLPGQWREDAAARLVKAYQQTGRFDQCAAARSEYLQRFSSGIHRSTVESLCPPSPTP